MYEQMNRMWTATPYNSFSLDENLSFPLLSSYSLFSFFFIFLLLFFLIFLLLLFFVLFLSAFFCLLFLLPFLLSLFLCLPFHSYSFPFPIFSALLSFFLFLFCVDKKTSWHSHSHFDYEVWLVRMCVFFVGHVWVGVDTITMGQSSFGTFLSISDCSILKKLIFGNLKDNVFRSFANIAHSVLPLKMSITTGWWMDPTTIFSLKSGWDIVSSVCSACSLMVVEVFGLETCCAPLPPPPRISASLMARYFLMNWSS